MSSLRAFFDELALPASLVRSVAARVAAECPRLKARFRKSPWLTSLSGLQEYRAKAGYDGNGFHAYVITRRCSPDHDAPVARCCDCGTFATRAEAMRTAHRQAARLATLKTLWPGDH
ncbi:hypothetical protein [Cedecea neteri]|uniref:Uncharacterized protein n=1 Tax=Cedecea neteri TaxID=158822 RepID=A0A291E3Q4_9ENTR|nr:hypothetical protein [Cedecea neteri]ATF94488.1 hypothetical protein CO704_21510 [Cedecea neteri]